MKNINYFHFIVLSIFLIVSGCGNKKNKKIEEFIRPVKFAKVGYTGYGSVRTFTGTAKSDKEIGLSFRTSGILTTLNITAGQVVKKGELLAKIDNLEAKLSLEQAIASLNSAETSFNTATSTLERTRKLYEKGSSSLSDYENARSSYANAKANYESSLRTVGIQKKQVSYGEIYCPRDGVIASKEVEINENVSAGQVIAYLNAGKFMEVSLGIPENVINHLRIKMPVKVHFSSLSNDEYSGYVKEIAPSIDANSSTYPVRIRLEGDTKLVKSGMSADVQFNFAVQGTEQLLVVPSESVGEDANGNYVLVINDEGNGLGVVEKRHVKIGELIPSGFEIIEGVGSGENVAVAGLQTLLDGEKVKIKK